MQALDVVMNGSRNLLDIALNHLSLGRAPLYRAILGGPSLGGERAQDAIEEAVAGLRAAGSTHHIPAVF